AARELSFDCAVRNWNTQSGFDLRDRDEQNAAVHAGFDLLVQDFGVEFEFANEVASREFFAQNSGFLFEHNWSALRNDGQGVVVDLEFDVIEHYAWESDFENELIIEFQDVCFGGGIGP